MAALYLHYLHKLILKSQSKPDLVHRCKKLTCRIIRELRFPGVLCAYHEIYGRIPIVDGVTISKSFLSPESLLLFEAADLQS